MTLDNKFILLISPEHWDHIFVSKHHYAVHLAKRNNKVFFLNPPGSTWKISPSRFEGVTIVDYPTFPTGLRYFPSFLQRSLIRKKYEQLEKALSVKFDVIWSFDNSVFFDFSSLPQRVIKLMHMVDLNQNFQFKRAAETAEFCFCTTDLIKDRLLKYNSRSYKINHGYNAIGEHHPVALPGTGVAKALYSGNLSMPYMDWSLIHEIVINHPDVDFVFAGPKADDFSGDGDQGFKRKVFSHKNVFAVGKVDSQLLQSYLRAADILLVSYQEKYEEDQANPHKIMEYLGSGKVIVATHTAEYKSLDTDVMVNVEHDQFVTAFAQVRNDLDRYNSAALMNRRQQIAADNSYSRQIERIEEKINVAI